MTWWWDLFINIDLQYSIFILLICTIGFTAECIEEKYPTPRGTRLGLRIGGSNVTVGYY